MNLSGVKPDKRGKQKQKTKTKKEIYVKSEKK